MKIYRVYGSCHHDWECSCEKTLKTFKNKEKAKEYSKSLSINEIGYYCCFCNCPNDSITVKIEELEVEE